MLEVYHLLISFSEIFLKKRAKLFPYYQCYSLENCYLAFPNPCDPRWLLSETCGRHALRGSRLCSCLPSTPPSAAARPPRDESQ